MRSVNQELIIDRMDPVRRLSLLWSWLPAFRAVAESEHLPTASRQLGVTPQALSRSVKLLENALGATLFVRQGRRMRLSDEGARFLESVRLAMRILDDGVDALGQKALRGPARIAALTHDAWLFVQPALDALVAEAPELTVHIHSLEPDSAGRDLRRGALDVVVGAAVPADATVTVQPLARLAYGVFCGPGHPLFRRRKVSIHDVVAHAFVAPEADGIDGWPPTIERRVGVRVASFHLGLELCWGGQYLAFLPDTVRRADRWRRPLHRLPLELDVTRDVFMSYRKSRSRQRLTDALVAALGSAARRA